MVIVEDEPGTAGFADLMAMGDTAVVLQHLALDSAGSSAMSYREMVGKARSADTLLPRITWATPEAAASGQLYLANGQLEPAVAVQPGELRRLRILNAGVCLKIPGSPPAHY
jgi:FtsP/CotA-like multicopper oxidase with cupredoxin domain